MNDLSLLFKTTQTGRANTLQNYHISQRSAISKCLFGMVECRFDIVKRRIFVLFFEQ